MELTVNKSLPCFLVKYLTAAAAAAAAAARGL